MTASLPAEAWARLLRAGDTRHHEAGHVLRRLTYVYLRVFVQAKRQGA